MTKKIVFGGNFRNKGAEALTYSIVNLLHKKYRDDEIVLLDLFPSKYGDDKKAYPFSILNMHVKTLFRLQFPLLKLISCPTHKSDSEREIKDLFNNADGFYDISGYGVSSHNQKIIWTLATIFPALWAKRHNISVLLMPQSLGPFEFKGFKRLILRPLVAKYLATPNIIFIREPICRKYIAEFRTENVIDSPDLVLLDSEPTSTKNNDYKTIALIPNMQLARMAPYESVVTTFVSIADLIIKSGRSVAIIAHASGDLSLCRQIASHLDANMVKLYDHILSVSEAKQAIAITDGVVTSRYHGAVHALKQCKPIFVIGWAAKYGALIDLFNLSRNYFDVSAKNSDILSSVELFSHWLEDGFNDSEIIKQKLQEIQIKNDIIRYL